MALSSSPPQLTFLTSQGACRIDGIQQSSRYALDCCTIDVRVVMLTTRTACMVWQHLLRLMLAHHASAGLTISGIGECHCGLPSCMTPMASMGCHRSVMQGHVCMHGSLHAIRVLQCTAPVHIP